MESLEQLSKKAKLVIENILYVTIATVDKNGNPWNTPVYSAYSNDYTFYWVSDKENSHSKNIQETQKAFLVVYDSTAPEGTGFGVFMEGTPQMLDDTNTKEIHEVSRLLSHRKDKSPRDIKEYLGEYPRRIFKFTPSRIYVNIDGEKNGNFVDTRVDITDFLLK